MTAKKATFTDRRRSELRRRRLHRFGLFLVIAVPVGMGAWVVRSPLLDVDHLRVQGTGRVSPAQVLAAAQVHRGQPMVDVDVADIRRRVLALAPVREVYVDRVWPSRVVITIVERKPLLAVRRAAGGVVLYDIDGVSIATQPVAPKGVAVVSVASTSDPGHDLVASVVQVVTSLPVALRDRVAAVRISTGLDLELTLNEGVTVAWGAATDNPQKARVLVAVLKPGVRHVDVRSPSSPAVRS